MRTSGKMRPMQDAFVDCGTTRKANFRQQNFQTLENLSGDRGCFLQASHSTDKLIDTSGIRESRHSPAAAYALENLLWVRLSSARPLKSLGREFFFV